MSWAWSSWSPMRPPAALRLAAAVGWPRVSAGYLHAIGADGRDDVGIGGRCNPGTTRPVYGRLAVRAGRKALPGRRPRGNNREDGYGHRTARACGAADRADRP